MKKILVALILAMAVIGCGGKEKEKNVLYVYGWANTIPQSIYEDFEKGNWNKSCRRYLFFK